MPNDHYGMKMETNTKLEITKNHWESPSVESLKDSNLRRLEISSIITSMKRYANTSATLKLADFGCGDGLDTQKFSAIASRSVGFDYSHEMLSRATRRQSDILGFKHLDLITDAVPGTYDIAISKRFVINLGDWSIQSACINKIAKSILPGGLFLFLECYKQGFDNLNFHRNRVGLPSLVEPYHNSYLDFDKTVSHLNESFEIIEMVDFSTYYYFTRCLTPFLASDKAFEFDEKIRLFSEADDVLQGSFMGPQKLMCLRKK